MAVVGHELPGVVQPGDVLRERLGRRARGRSKRNVELSTKVDERAFLQSHLVYEALIAKTLSLPGRPKLSISKNGKSTDTVVSFERKISLRRMEVSWSSVVVGVEKSTDGLSVKLNAGAVSTDIDERQAGSMVQSAIDNPYQRVWTIPDHPMEYFKERWGWRRTRITSRH